MMRWMSSETHGGKFWGKAPRIYGDLNLGDGKPLQLQSANNVFYNRGNGSVWSAGSYWSGTGGRPAFDASKVSNIYTGSSLNNGNAIEPAGLLMYYVVKY